MNKKTFMLQRQYELALLSDFASGAYHENGCRVSCPKCAYNAILWSCDDKLWFCPQCGYELDRKQFFQLIDAESNPKCLACDQNYPYCSMDCKK